MTTDETSPLLHDSASERTTYTHPDNDVPDPEGFAAKKPPAIQMASIVSMSNEFFLKFFILPILENSFR